MEDAAGDSMDKHFQAAERQSKSPPKEQRFENDDSHLRPSRWWFASSAFPMIAGTLGPVASAFSICALVRPWRQHLPPGTGIQDAPYVKDPPWLLIVNGIQLVVAVVANMCLLLNMGRQLRFDIAQPITIVGWYISALCLLSLNAAAAGPLLLQPESNFVWSQAFYYGMFAAILYFIVASLMVVNFWGAQSGHYEKDFKLTSSQRTLMLQTIAFLVYLLLGALVFSTIEGWNYLDAVYWADVTLFTVGFGDFSASTPLGRGLLIPYALVGVISLGLVIGSIRSLVLERGKGRVDARMVEKNRRRMIRRLTEKGEDDVLVPRRGTDGPDLSPVSDPGTGVSIATELQRREEEFKLMRKVQHEAALRRRWFSMGMATGTWLVLWLVGAKIFQLCEQPYQYWTYFDGFYFAFVSLTTIGYGDKTPISNSGKSFFVFWSLLALPTMTVLISNAGDTVVKFIRDGTNRLGTITILPGEQGFKKSFKYIISRLTQGRVFEDNYQEDTGPEDPPGFLGAAQPTNTESSGAARVSDSGRFVNEEDVNGVGYAAGRPPTDTPCPEQHVTNQYRPSLPQGLSQAPTTKPYPTTLPPTQAQYHLVLIEEIARVIDHLKQTPPRRYTFREWAWYLQLIGEDENSAETHGKAQAHTHRKDHRKDTYQSTDGDGDRGSTRHLSLSAPEDTQWSWVGTRSPLMGSQEEAEWILRRLAEKLTEELKDVSDNKSDVNDAELEDVGRPISSGKGDYSAGTPQTPAGALGFGRPKSKGRDS